jgi:adenine deaminase
MIRYHYLIDIHRRRIRPAEIRIENGRIQSVRETDQPCTHYILPGLVDAHVHVESSMLVPSEFARFAVRHGTVATVSDPHEIANVCGIEGVEFMLRNAAKVPLKIHFGAPSCVPATAFETAGATLDAGAVRSLLQRPDIFYLSEMMNYPGVLHGDAQVMAKIAAAHEAGKPVDGHAPGLRGDDAKRYAAAGIQTDHECVSREEALDKLACGMHILIREGSAARNFDALIGLLPEFPDLIMFCCDDKHPDELELHHINHHVQRALAAGYDLFDVLQAACLNPVKHYKLPVGLLREGDAADFIVIDDPASFRVLETVIDGETVFDGNQSLFPVREEEQPNQFNCAPVEPGDIRVAVEASPEKIRVIEALDGQLITRTCWMPPKVSDGALVSDPDADLLKIVVMNRYRKAPVAKAFIHRFGLKKGAIASTVAHDSHNIIAVGADDASLQRAINALVACRGGVAVDDGADTSVLPLPVAGLMSTDPAEVVARRYAELDRAAKALGSELRAPFMTLSFMALLVIPQLKLSDLGLFDGEQFTFVDLW